MGFGEDLEAGRLLPEQVLAGSEPRLLLATDPNDRMLDRLPLAAQLRSYWRVLFRAAVMRAIDRDIDSSVLGEADCLERLERFGLAAAREIRAVLLAEHLITAEANATLRYRAFAALYLDLASFEPEAVGHYFPSLPSGSAVTRLLEDELDAGCLLAAMRPPGADEAIAEARPEESPETTEPAEAEQAPSDKPMPLLEAAHEAEERGNNVRAAILRTQCGMVAAGDDRSRALSGADAALGKLVDALGGVFNWSEETRQEWRHNLAPLLMRAARGFWPRAARCLYELQKIPANLSREVFAVDLAESIRTFGRRPVKRPLPHARPVLILMSLKKAQSLMLRAGLRAGRGRGSIGSFTSRFTRLSTRSGTNSRRSSRMLSDGGARSVERGRGGGARQAHRRTLGSGLRARLLADRRPAQHHCPQSPEDGRPHRPQRVLSR